MRPGVGGVGACRGFVAERNDRVGAEDDVVRVVPRDGLAFCDARNSARSAGSIGAWSSSSMSAGFDEEGVARVAQQLLPPRRRAGQDEARLATTPRRAKGLCFELSALLRRLRATCCRPACPAASPQALSVSAGFWSAAAFCARRRPSGRRRPCSAGCGGLGRRLGGGVLRSRSAGAPSVGLGRRLGGGLRVGGVGGLGVVLGLDLGGRRGLLRLRRGRGCGWGGGVIRGRLAAVGAASGAAAAAAVGASAGVGAAPRREVRRRGRGLRVGGTRVGRLLRSACAA
jgi:hypothetical protein